MAICAVFSTTLPCATRVRDTLRGKIRDQALRPRANFLKRLHASSINQGHDRSVESDEYVVELTQGPLLSVSDGMYGCAFGIPDVSDEP